MLYVHENGERVRPAADSPNEEQLAAKVADPASGWSVEAEDGDEQPSPAPRGRKAPAPAPATEETS